jgi:uncharacterized membrane protein YphA (DoxX/SURF4 family)
MTQLSATRTLPNRGLNIALWVLQALLAVAFLAAGGSKLAGVQQMVALFDQIGVGQWFRFVTGSVEVGAALALLLPRLTPYAAGILSMTMVCAFVTHLFVIGGSPVAAAVLAALSGFVAYGRWSRS